ncbi:hypothetical protein HPB48_020809 [Haemaphysalis longicornis]|uniref:Uncharacterized protein n=1 Tax=Haemaphysalis longicornis TaxID=44386 RepID=A0A9J6H295_HAELO|nr:hypothetical protein HPB48_020809 [Haemaphysalis longicornis]
MVIYHKRAFLKALRSSTAGGNKERLREATRNCKKQSQKASARLQESVGECNGNRLGVNAISLEERQVGCDYILWRFELYVMPNVLVENVDAGARHQLPEDTSQKHKFRDKF